MKGFKINNQAFADWSGGNSVTKKTLKSGEKIESVKHVTCTWHGLDVISDLRFYTNQGRTFGPYGKCRQGNSPGWSKYKQSFGKRHVRLDKLTSQVKMTSNKYAGRHYAKYFTIMGKFYNSEPRFFWRIHDWKNTNKNIV